MKEPKIYIYRMKELHELTKREFTITKEGNGFYKAISDKGVIRFINSGQFKNKFKLKK